MTGAEFIKWQGIKELSYKEAIAVSMKEAKENGFFNRYQLYDNDDIFDMPMYPANAKLYDEFVDINGNFEDLEYYLFIVKKIELDELEKILEE